MTKEKWVVAVSGGPDSMALLYRLQKNYECIVAHVNYHMRKESNQEAAMVRDFCIAHNIAFNSKDYLDTVGGNFQHKAREFRYDFFKELVDHYQAKGVAVGHHQDDDIETYLIQKERKMRSDAIGLKPYARVKDMVVWRPLLNLTKDDLINFCNEKGIPFAIDGSNLETKYTRNEIRQRSLDKTQILNEMVERRTDEAAFKQLIDTQINYHATTLSLSQYKAIDQTLRPYILRQWVRAHGGDVHHLRAKFFNELDRQIIRSKAYHDFGSVQIFCDHGLIALANPRPFRFVIHTLPKCIDGVCCFEDVGEKNQGLHLRPQDFPLIIRSYEPGDMLELSYGRKSVSRYFIDQKIPRYRRKNWLVIENAVNEVIFVVGMGCDVRHYSNNPQTFVIELNVS